MPLNMVLQRLQVGCMPTSLRKFGIKDLDCGAERDPMALGLSRLTSLQTLKITGACEHVLPSILEDSFCLQPVLERLMLGTFEGINFKPSAVVLHGLQMLRLDDCGLHNVPAVLAGAQRLRCLSLQGNPGLRIGLADCDTLLSMPKLEHVWLAKEPFKDDQVEVLPVEPAPWDVESIELLMRFPARFAKRYPRVSCRCQWLMLRVATLERFFCGKRHKCH